MEQMNDIAIRRGFTRLGERLAIDHDVEILIVGGAAGLLTGELPSTMTTMDAHAIWYRPSKDRDTVLETAAEVARELSLPSDWLNEWSGLYAWSLPDDWEGRRVLIGKFGHLHVYAASRIDLIVMKFIAHRESDLDHLVSMNVKSDELEFIQRELDLIAVNFPNESGKIAMAKHYALNWGRQK